MSKNLLASLIFGATFLAVGHAAAQAPAPAPAPVPDAMPFDTPYGAPITLEQAKKAAEAAMAESKKRNWKHAIAVVDQSGDLVYFLRMDSAQYAGAAIAEHKARAAARFRRPTKTFFDAMESGHPYVVTLDGMIASDGGLPIIENGKVIGGIGSSGGTGAQDAIVSKAGADTIK